MNATPDSPSTPEKCPRCQAPLAREANSCAVCGWTAGSPLVSEPGVQADYVVRKRPPAWGLLAATVLPGILSAATARTEAAALAAAVGGSFLVAIYGAFWAWRRFRQLGFAKVLLSLITGACCGAVALTLSAVGCAMGG